MTATTTRPMRPASSSDADSELPRAARRAPTRTGEETATASRISVLVVDDDESIRASCASILQVDGYDVTLCTRGQEAVELLGRRRFQIVLVDQHLPAVTGFDVLRAAMAVSTDTLVVVMTGNPSVQSSVEALRAGAWDYLPKPFTATQLQVLVGRAAHTVAISRETLVGGVDPGMSRATGSLLGASPAFRNVIELARKVAATDASVFITGDSGSGKEMIARFIHEHSRRASRPFVAVNAAALPETLLESEMFGHRKGAFTDAVRDKAGLMETANGGTLFLDELLEMSRPIQAKLLRVIQDGVVRRVGSEQTDAVVNVRFIAATNRSPETAIQDSTLREDLFYRLCVVPIHVPPLRERIEDIRLLADHFLKTYWSRHRAGTGTLPAFTDEAIRALETYAWPGNVRELQNVVEHAVVLVEPGSNIKPSDLAFTADETKARAATSRGAFTPAVLDEGYHAARDRIIGDFEVQYLTWLIERAGGNMSKAARIAGVDRTTLYRLMERHDLHRSPNATWIVERTTNGNGNGSAEHGPDSSAQSGPQTTT